jgi:acetolactate synthase-1/3 small subunit
MAPAHAISILIDNDLLALNRAIGVVRRRNLPIASIAVGPSQLGGVSRLTLMVQGDQATADRIAQQLQKTFGVRDAAVFPADGAVSREVALIKVRAAAADRPALLAVVSGCGAAVVDEGPGVCIVQLTGEAADADACVRALERFGILEVARSGAIALPGTQTAPSSPSPRNPSEAVL